MGYLKAALEIVALFLKWITGRQDLGNQPDLVKAKKAQEEQAQTDRIERLTKTAMSDPDPKRREAALEELRRMASE